MRLGFRKSDMFTTLTVDEMISIVLAAQPGTAIYHSVNGGWTTTDHLLATAVERDAGLVEMSQRVTRPGVTDTRPSTPPNIHEVSQRQPVQKIAFDAMPLDELKARLKQMNEGE